MKFGKRLRRECHAEWVSYYLDYKELKQVIKSTVIAGSDGTAFFNMLDTEMDKINDFFCGRVALFEEMFPFLSGRLQKGDPKIDSFMQWCEGLDHLRKYVVLNYIAVRKIVKKYDKNTNNTTPVPPILSKQPFYNSLSLARLITKTEIMVAKHNGTNLADSFLCPVCLEILHAPVVLSCAHIFCWSCLARAAQFTCNNACPVCRKEVPLDPTAYKVDSLLQRFLSQNLPEQIQRKGFGYFFQTAPPARNLKVLLAPARFATPQHAVRFAVHCNSRHTDAQFCVFADNSPSYRQAIQLPSSKVMFVDTQVDPAALRKGETLVPFVEAEGEITIGKAIVVGFRVGLPGADKPVYEKQFNQSKPALVFMKYLPFDCLEKTSFDKLLKKHANGIKYLFILDSPDAQTGVWNNIPYTKLMSAGSVDATKPRLSSSSLSSSISIPYQEIIIKQEHIHTHDRSFVEEPTILSKPLPSSSSPLHTFFDTHMGESVPSLSSISSSLSSTLSPSTKALHSNYLDTHPYPNAYTLPHGPAETKEGKVFEDNVWSVVSKVYLIILVLVIAYFVRLAF